MKILVPDNVDKLIVQLMTDLGYEVSYRPGLEITETARIVGNYDAVIVRSYPLHDVGLEGRIKAVGRAGAGVNNIPVEACAEKGVVVFNTPGANANAVKELVICGLILSSRGIAEGIAWAKTIKSNVSITVEKNKGGFKGSEIIGKKLGVIGLGAVGCQIANSAYDLGMEVMGFDPFITVDNALRLSRSVKRTEELKSLLADADYLTVHVPISEGTSGMINEDVFSRMKPGIKLLNFSRAEIVDKAALLEALDKGIVEKYVTDFPDDDLIRHGKVITIPHLGASTKEAEENCAKMMAAQIHDFLKTGNTTNSVNYPETHLDRYGGTRLAIFNRNVPGIVSKISETLSADKLNIAGMINKSKGDFAYNIVDIDGGVPGTVVEEIGTIKGIIRIRKLEK
jgi:D-3-phosphoglycerate dehydrogenase